MIIDAAGRTSSNSSLWARPTSSTSRAWVRYIRVRTTSSAPRPSSLQRVEGDAEGGDRLLVRAARGDLAADDRGAAGHQDQAVRAAPRRGSSRRSPPRGRRSATRRTSMRLISDDTASSASSRVNALAYSALPTIAPSTPSGTRAAMARRSSREETPPEATTGRSVAAQTFAQQLQVGALERAVLGDVGDDVAGAALGVQAGQRLVQVAAVAGPAAAAQRRAAYVQADRDLVAVLGDDLGDPLGGLQRGGAEVDPAAAGGQRGGQRGVVADAAGQLDLDVHGAGDLGDQLPVVAGAEGGVQVDQVQPLGARALPGQGGLQRVAVGGLGAGLAVHEADGLAVADVDGGEEFERCWSRLQASQGLDPVGQQLGAGVAGLLGVELGRPQRRRSPRRRRTARRARPR